MPGDRGKAREHGGGEAHAASPGGSAGRAATVPAPVIEISGLSRRYGDRDALAGVDLTVAGGGACVGIFGPNGAGKTTLLKIIATLIRPTSGSVVVAGHALPQEAQMVRARIGVLLDRPFIPREFSLWEGLCYSADLHGVDNPAERILELLDRFRLTWRRRDPVRTFSRGMAQRASLACALLSEPQILILDEPFSGLDPAGCAIVEEAIAETRAAGGTVLLVTHDLERGARLCDEVVVIDRGRLAFRGSGGRWSLEDLTAVYR